MRLTFENARLTCVQMLSESRFIKGVWWGAGASSSLGFPDKDEEALKKLAAWFRDMAEALEKGEEKK